MFLVLQVYVHTSLESLYKFVPKSILPSDYGGEEVSVDDLSGELKQMEVE